MTIGPASRSPEVIGHPIDEGMDVARLNFFSRAHADHAATLQAVREASRKRGAARRSLSCRICRDRKIRVGKIQPGTVPGSRHRVRPDHR